MSYGDLDLMFVLFSIQNQKTMDPFTLSSSLFSLCRVSSVGDKILPTLFDFVFMNMTHGAVPIATETWPCAYSLFMVLCHHCAMCAPSISSYYINYKL